MTAGRSHTHTWNAAATNVAGARDFVALRLAESGLDSVVPDARLVVSELVTNAVRHADTWFTLTVLIQDGSLLLTVTDPTSTWPVLAVDPPFAADVSPADGMGLDDGLGLVDGLPSDRASMVDAMSLAEGGRGLGIVAALSSSWGVTPEPHGGKSVWAWISPPAPPDGFAAGMSRGGGAGDPPPRRPRRPS